MNDCQRYVNRRTSVGIVDGDVANRELLVTDPHAEVASIEHKVCVPR